MPTSYQWLGQGDTGGDWMPTSPSAYYIAGGYQSGASFPYGAEAALGAKGNGDILVITYGNPLSIFGGATPPSTGQGFPTGQQQ